MAESAQVSPLQALLSGELMPSLPPRNPEWDLKRYQQEMEIWHRKLLEYIRRLMQRLIAPNIVNEIRNEITTIINEIINDGLADWKYDTTTHKFQVKRFEEDGTIGAWEDTTGGQPGSVSHVSDWQYNATTHKFQYKTQAVYVLESAAASSFGNAGGDQPVVITRVVSDVSYSTSTHLLEQDDTADVYVLDKGSITSDRDITEAIPCS